MVEKVLRRVFLRVLLFSPSSLSFHQFSLHFRLFLQIVKYLNINTRQNITLFEEVFIHTDCTLIMNSLLATTFIITNITIKFTFILQYMF